MILMNVNPTIDGRENEINSKPGEQKRVAKAHTHRTWQINGINRLIPLIGLITD